MVRFSNQISLVLFCSFFILLSALSVRGDIIYPSWNGMDFFLETDKSEYTLTKQVHGVYRVHNPFDESVEIIHSRAD